MGDIGRWLRYAAPGSLALALFSLWLFLDNSLCTGSCEPSASIDVSAGTGVLAAGAAVPVGFLISVLAAQVVWLPWRVRLWVSPLPDQDIATACWPDLLRLVPSIALAGVQLATVSRQQASVIINMALQRAKGADEFRASSQRVEYLIDLNNGLANGSTACMLTALTILGVAFLTGGFDATRWPAAAGAMVLSALLGLLFAVGQNRVMGLVNLWLRLLLPSVQVPDQENGRADISPGSRGT